MALCATHDDRLTLPVALHNLARAQLALGDPGAAGRSLRRAIALAFESARTEVEKTPKPSKKNIERGKAKLVTSGCTACHGFGAAVPASPGVPNAPDLAHTRERVQQRCWGGLRCRCGREWQ